MPRKRFLWKLKERELQLGDRTLVAAVLNVTPDSFSDGGQFLDPDRAFGRAVELEEAGADILDIGAESTRPGATRISEEEELRRLVPVLKRLRGKLTIPISVDTYKYAVAQRALELGAEIINDPTGLTFDPQIAKAAATHDAALIVNHMRGTPDTWAKLGPVPDPVNMVLRELDASVHRARRAGIDPLRIAVDPGIGFGKRKEESARLITELYHLHQLNLPLHLGPSRKSFLAQATPEGLLMGTAAAVTAAILNGVHILRLHDVAPLIPTIQVADSLLRARVE
ncbi:MAG: dihydropteroate synthase [Acidimicrobiia bacterium]|nr:dihydropteroate synthase [Acidimicrobiia bacterium]